MASEVPRMEQDVEDGEISGSDCEMPVSAPSRSPQQNDNGNPAISFPSTSSQSATSVPYRTVKSMDSTDESFSDSDEESGLWKRKRQKCSNLPPPKPELFQFSPNSQKQIPKKVNNIWGEVLQKQNQDDMAKNLGILWMDGNLDKRRGSEAYNYILAKQLVKQSESEVGKTLDKELDEYMQDDKKIVSKEEEEEVNRQSLWKRKRPIKERVGQRQEMNFKGRYEITEDDPEEKVADEIAYRLHEPKKDLIVRVVKIIGKKKSIELLMETAEVEQNGGLLIMDGSRRRTPGGVYINLLKNTPCITSEQIKEIFYIENQKEYENKCAAKKRRFQVLGKKMKQAIKGLNLQEYDDASRETFASDTNEALASLDDLQEGHGEIKLDVEHVFETDESDSASLLDELPTARSSISCSMSSSPKAEPPEGSKTNMVSKGVNTNLRGVCGSVVVAFPLSHLMRWFLTRRNLIKNVDFYKTFLKIFKNKRRWLKQSILSEWEMVNDKRENMFIHCHLPRFSCKHGMIPKQYVMPWKQDMKYRALHLQHADQVELYSGAREDTLFLEKSERHCHGEDRKKVMQKVPQEDIIVDIPIYSHLSRYHKSMVAYGFRIKL